MATSKRKASESISVGKETKNSSSSKKKKRIKSTTEMTTTSTSPKDPQNDGDKSKMKMKTTTATATASSSSSAAVPPGGVEDDLAVCTTKELFILLKAYGMKQQPSERKVDIIHRIKHHLLMSKRRELWQILNYHGLLPKSCERKHRTIHRITQYIARSSKNAPSRTATESLPPARTTNAHARDNVDDGSADNDNDDDDDDDADADDDTSSEPVAVVVKVKLVKEFRVIDGQQYVEIVTAHTLPDPRNNIFAVTTAPAVTVTCNAHHTHHASTHHVAYHYADDVTYNDNIVVDGVDMDVLDEGIDTVETSTASEFPVSPSPVSQQQQRRRRQRQDQQQHHESSPSILSSSSSSSSSPLSMAAVAAAAVAAKRTTEAKATMSTPIAMTKTVNATTTTTTTTTPMTMTVMASSLIAPSLTAASMKPVMPRDVTPESGTDRPITSLLSINNHSHDRRRPNHHHHHHHHGCCHGCTSEVDDPALAGPPSPPSLSDMSIMSMSATATAATSHVSTHIQLSSSTTATATATEKLTPMGTTSPTTMVLPSGLTTMTTSSLSPPATTTTIKWSPIIPQRTLRHSSCSKTHMSSLGSPSKSTARGLTVDTARATTTTGATTKTTMQQQKETKSKTTTKTDMPTTRTMMTTTTTATTTTTTTTTTEIVKGVDDVALACAAPPPPPPTAATTELFHSKSSTTGDVARQLLENSPSSLSSSSSSSSRSSLYSAQVSSSLTSLSSEKLMKMMMTMTMSTKEILEGAQREQESENEGKQAFHESERQKASHNGQQKQDLSPPIANKKRQSCVIKLAAAATSNDIAHKASTGPSASQYGTRQYQPSVVYVNDQSLDRNMVSCSETGRSFVFTTDLGRTKQLPEMLFLDLPDNHFCARFCGVDIVNALSDVLYAKRLGKKSELAFRQAAERSMNAKGAPPTAEKYPAGQEDGSSYLMAMLSMKERERHLQDLIYNQSNNKLYIPKTSLKVPRQHVVAKKGKGGGRRTNDSTAAVASCNDKRDDDLITINGIYFRMRMYLPQTQMWETCRANFFSCQSSLESLLCEPKHSARYGIIVLLPFVHAPDNKIADSTARNFWGHLSNLPHPTSRYTTMMEIDQYVCNFALRMGIRRGGLPAPVCSHTRQQHEL